MDRPAFFLFFSLSFLVPRQKALSTCSLRFARYNKEKKKERKRKEDTPQRETGVPTLFRLFLFFLPLFFFNLSFPRLRNASEALYASDRIVPCFRLATAVN